MSRSTQVAALLAVGEHVIGRVRDLPPRPRATRFDPIEAGA
ncbi:hypothetical protein ACL03H_04865 [Saccharopolyspora sp. MS10]